MHRRWQRLLAAALAAGMLALTGASAPAVPAGAARAPRARGQVGGLLAGRITALGDSVMIDYAGDLAHDLHNVQVDATVGEQWYTGVAVARSLRARHELGAEAVVGLGTNGPISMAEFDAMRRALAGARRVVFVTVHVDRPWQSEVNAVLRAGVRTMPNARLADWYRLSAPHPGWFYGDGTHLPIGGTGAQALAALVTRTLEAPARPARAGARAGRHPRPTVRTHR